MLLHRWQVANKPLTRWCHIHRTGCLYFIGSIRTLLVRLNSLLELALHINARRLVDNIPVGNGVQLAVSGLQYVATRHRRRVVVPQLVLGLLALLYALGYLALMAAATSENGTNVSEVSD